MPAYQNVFFAIEGIDGTGKTSTAIELCKLIDGTYIKTPPKPFELTRRQFDKPQDLRKRFAFYLSSVVFASGLIEKELLSKSVVADRYIDSTFAYHEALGLILPAKKRIRYSIAQPQVLVVLHADERTLRWRFAERVKAGQTVDRFETNRVLQRKVDDLFHQLDAIHIDTSELSPEETAKLVVRLSDARKPPQKLAVGGE